MDFYDWILVGVVVVCIVVIAFYIWLGPSPRYPGERD
jgi:hypothetical protein